MLLRFIQIKENHRAPFGAQDCLLSWSFHRTILAWDVYSRCRIGEVQRDGPEKDIDGLGIVDDSDYSKGLIQV